MSAEFFKSCLASWLTYVPAHHKAGRTGRQKLTRSRPHVHKSTFRVSRFRSRMLTPGHEEALLQTSGQRARATPPCCQREAHQANQALLPLSSSPPLLGRPCPPSGPHGARAKEHKSGAFSRDGSHTHKPQIPAKERHFGKAPKQKCFAKMLTNTHITAIPLP